MRKTAFLILLPALVALSACEGDQNEAVYESASIQSAPPAPRMAMDAAEMKRSGGEADMATGGDVEAPQSMMAYRYNYGISLPAQSVEPVMKQHMERCLQAGPSACQVLNASSNEHSEDYSSAYLSLRATPGWLDEFRNGLETSLEASNGRVIDSSVSAEDLTRRIFDADARLQAQTALRERLLALLETRDANLQDLLSVERELARVQAEIESAEAQLKTLRQRVSMSVMDIRYESRARAVTQSAFSPVIEALTGFFRTLSHGLASVIGFIAVALPWLLFVILPGIALFRWVLRRRRKPAKE